MTLLLQQDTLHGLRHLASLVHMCAKRVRKEAYMALGTVKDVFQHTLLPPDRKLRPFSGSVEAWAARSGTTATAAATESTDKDDVAGDDKDEKGGRRRGGRRRARKVAAEAAEVAGKASRPGVTLVPCEPSSEQLTVWLLEDRVRQQFAAFLVALESCAGDAMAHLKRTALRCTAEMLAAAPEGESRLLTLLVSKLGDPDRKVASSAAHHLSTLCGTHSAMKTIVVANVRAFVLDGSTSDRARYYGVTFLTQLPLHRGWRTLVTSLLGTYLAVFQRSLVTVERKPRAEGGRNKKHKKKGGLRGSKHDSDGADATPDTTAAAPASDSDSSDEEPEAEAAPEVLGASKKSARVAQQELVTRVSAQVLGSRLMGAILTGLNRALPYALSLPEEGAVKSKKGGTSDVPSAIAPLVEQLGAVFQLTRSGPLGTRVQALTLIYTVAAALAEQEGIQADEGAAAAAAAAEAEAGGTRATTGAGLLKQFFISLYGLLVSPDLLPGRKSHHLLLNLLFKCLRREHSAARVAAMLKRLGQVALTAQPPLACGILMLLSAVLKDRPGLLSLLSQAEVLAGAEAPAKASKKAEKAALTIEDEEEADPLMAGAEGDVVPAVSRKGRGVSGMYDPRGRVPDSAGAAESCFWEMLSLSTHFHPSVRAMAEALLEQGTSGGPGVQYDGDPMADMTLMAFLDRLAFRKPKKKAIAAMEAQRKVKKGTAAEGEEGAGALRGDSIMQRSGVQGMRTGFAAVAVPVDNRAFTSLPANKVRPEEAFLHGYFLAKTQREASEGAEKKPKKGGDEEDNGEVSDAEGDAFANELAEAMMAEHAATAGGGLGDGEDDISDSEWAYDAGSAADGVTEDAAASGDDTDEAKAPARKGPAPAKGKGKDGKRGVKRERKSPFASADGFEQDATPASTEVAAAEEEAGQDAAAPKGRGKRGGKKARH
jgi:ribosome biogenesis protein MAK21